MFWLLSSIDRMNEILRELDRVNISLVDRKKLELRFIVFHEVCKIELANVDEYLSKEISYFNGELDLCDNNYNSMQARSIILLPGILSDISKYKKLSKKVSSLYQKFSVLPNRAISEIDAYDLVMRMHNEILENNVNSSNILSDAKKYCDELLKELRLN